LCFEQEPIVKGTKLRTACKKDIFDFRE
jgi:hypothetical protein